MLLSTITWKMNNLTNFIIYVHEFCQIVCPNVPVLHNCLLVVSANLSRCTSLHTCSSVVSASLPKCTSITQVLTSCVSQSIKMYQFYIPVHQWCQLVYPDVLVSYTCPSVVSASIPSISVLQTCPQIVSASLPRCTKCTSFTYLSTCCVS